MTRPETKHKVIFTLKIAHHSWMATDEEVAWCAELRRAVTSLQDSIDAARSFDHVRLPADGPVSAADVVEYARRFSYTTFAPAGYQPGAPLHGIMPPAPQDEHLRRRTSRHTRHRRGRGRRRGGLGRRLRRRRGRRRAEGRCRRSRPSSSCCRRETRQPWPAGIPAPPPGWKPGIPCIWARPSPRMMGVRDRYGSSRPPRGSRGGDGTTRQAAKPRCPRCRS